MMTVKFHKNIDPQMILLFKFSLLLILLLLLYLLGMYAYKIFTKIPKYLSVEFCYSQC